MPIANYNEFIAQIKNVLNLSNSLNQTKTASNIYFHVELYNKNFKIFSYRFIYQKTGSFEKNIAFKASVLFTILRNICIGILIKLTLIRHLMPSPLTTF